MSTSSAPFTALSKLLEHAEGADGSKGSDEGLRVAEAAEVQCSLCTMDCESTY